MTTFVQNYPTVLLRTDTIEVKLATTLTEIDAALRLRFEVFNLEMQEGWLASEAHECAQAGEKRSAAEAFYLQTGVGAAETDSAHA